MDKQDWSKKKQRRVSEDEIVSSAASPKTGDCEEQTKEESLKPSSKCFAII
jgi:hypothetical protein